MNETPRVGFGVDVHRLVDGPGPLRICGVGVSAPYALEGTSDGDVGLHAVIDAVLGAGALGDIGEMFPSSDPKWQDADSRDLSRLVAERAVGEGLVVDSIDVTIVAESVRIAPMRDEMRQMMAAIYDVAVDRVSVKATSTDGLGLIGRDEGVAALAVAQVRSRSTQE